MSCAKIGPICLRPSWRCFLALRSSLRSRPDPINLLLNVRHTPNRYKPLRRRILLDDVAHLLLVRRSVLLEEVERISLRRRVRVRLVEQRLDAEQDLLDRYRRLPALLLVQDAEADGARGVDIRVEEGRGEFACRIARQYAARVFVGLLGTYTLAAWWDTHPGR
jgi:hypothetical protein